MKQRDKQGMVAKDSGMVCRSSISCELTEMSVTGTVRENSFDLMRCGTVSNRALV